MSTNITPARAAIVGTGVLVAALTGIASSIAAPAVLASQPTAAKSGSFVGATSKANKYTPTTVTIKVAKGKVVSVTAKTHSTDPASIIINKNALPQLTTASVGVTSAAQVAAVSGASLTSAAFKQSLQSALAKAGIKG